MPSVAVADQITWSAPGAALALAQLQAGVAATGPLAAGAKVDLFTANIVPTPFNVLADFAVPVVGGWASYVQKTVTTWGAARTDASGRVSNDLTIILEWVGPVAGAGPTVYGYLVSNAGGQWLYAARFPTPVPMVNSSNVLDVLVTFQFPNFQ